MSERTNLKFELFLLMVLAFLWGSSYLLIKIAVADIPPLTLIAARVTLAAVFLLAVLRMQGASLPKGWRTWRMLLIQAFLNSIGAWTVLAWGQQFVDSGLAAVLNSTSPIFVYFLALFFARHEPQSAWTLSGAVLGLCGVIAIVGVEVLEGLGRNVLAQSAVLAGALMYAGAAVYGKRFSHITPAATATGTMICATVALVPLCLIVDRPWTLTPSPGAIFAACGLGVICTAVALLIYFRLVRTIGSMGVASQSYIRAGIGVLLGIVLLGEQPTPQVAIGLALAIAGVAVINIVPAIGKRTEKAPDP